MKFNSPDIKEKLKLGIKDQLQIGLAFIIVGSLLLTETFTLHYLKKLGVGPAGIMQAGTWEFEVS